MSNMISEAIEVANDLKKVIIIGAVAVMLQTKKSRTSFDVDIALTGEISRDELLNLDYIPVEGKRDSWNSPRGIKIDIFREDVSGIPVRQIAETATSIEVGSNKTVKVICIEALIVAKFRAYNSTDRPNDEADLKLIIKKKLKDIDWNILEKFCKDELEYDEIIKTLKLYRKL